MLPLIRRYDLFVCRLNGQFRAFWQNVKAAGCGVKVSENLDHMMDLEKGEVLLGSPSYFDFLALQQEAYL